MTGAMQIGSDQFQNYEGWDDLIAIEREDVHDNANNDMTVMVAGLFYNHAEGPQPARTVIFEFGIQELNVDDRHGRHRYVRCPSDLGI